jgi:isocitrate lyase
VNALGALTGGQAVQMVKAGLQAIYLSGWQVAADANLSGQTYPDQSLYPANSVPHARAPLNNALLRADQIDWAEGRRDVLARADRRRRRGRLRRPAQRYELMKAMIEAGAAGVHFEDQLASRRSAATSAARCSCRPRSSSARSRGAPRRRRARRADRARRAHRRASGTLLTSDIDERDRAFLTGERTPEGFFRVRDGIDAAIAAGSPTRRTPTCSGSRPRRPTSARRASSPRAIHAEFPGKLLAYNCSPSFNWKKHLDDARSPLPAELGEHGLPLPVHHARRLPLAERLDVRAAHGYAPRDDRLRRLQEREFASRTTATPRPHQREVGAGYFDPADLLDRRVEITGPVERKMMINALNSGAKRLHGGLRGRQLADLGRTSSRARSTCATRSAGTIELDPDGKRYR